MIKEFIEFIYGTEPDVEDLVYNKNISGLIRALRYNKSENYRFEDNEFTGESEITNRLSVRRGINVRVSAAQALGSMKMDSYDMAKAVKGLIDALYDNHVEVVEAAITALAGIGDERAIEHFVRILFRNVSIKDKFFRDLDSREDERKEKLVFKILKQPQFRQKACKLISFKLNNKNWRIRELATYVLGEFNKLEKL